MAKDALWPKDSTRKFARLRAARAKRDLMAQFLSRDRKFEEIIPKTLGGDGTDISRHQ